MGKIKRAAQKAKTTTRARTGETGKPQPKGYEQAFEKIYRIVLKIPRGRVMTYGQIARLLEDRYSPRLVGWAMHATPKDGRNIPWHRVVNSKGGISTGRIIIQEPQLQQYLLEAEGVVFDERGHCDLSVYQWSPVARKKISDRPAKSTAKAKKGSKTKKVKER
ncbi:MAG TPA: MGMT family protein [Blastocatellia bacterium]|nr:MGMT family protein [Blastocatellia bacterium]